MVIARYAFDIIFNNFSPFDIDLFASKINNKCKKFVSWFPDPEAFAIDAFNLSWSNIYFYIFPPFYLILKILRKIRHDRATGVLVVPYWPTQAWFPMFKDLQNSKMIILKPDKKLISSPFRKEYPTWKSLTIVAATLSGKHS